MARAAAARGLAAALLGSSLALCRAEAPAADSCGAAGDQCDEESLLAVHRAGRQRGSDSGRASAGSRRPGAEGGRAPREQQLALSLVRQWESHGAQKQAPAPLGTPPTCFLDNVKYQPDMELTPSSTAADNAYVCQARCAVTEGCGYFSYSKNTCLLQPVGAIPYNDNDYTAGPPACLGSDYYPDREVAGLNMQIMSAQSCQASSWAPSCCQCGSCCVPYCPSGNKTWTKSQDCTSINMTIGGYCWDIKGIPKDPVTCR